MDKIFDAIRRTGFRRGPSRLVGGVCGGIAQQLGWNVTLVRVIVLVLLLLPVLSWIAYAVVWVLLPWQDGSIPLEQLFGGQRR